ncbi:MAG: porin family protein [Chitinophagaceae bacterium]
MQYIENDMDDLFRKAAANYPLKTDSNDWDKITPALITVTFSTAKKTSRTIKYGLPFLLAILSVAFFVSVSIPVKREQLSDISSKAPSPVINKFKELIPGNEKVIRHNTIHKRANTSTPLFSGANESLRNQPVKYPAQKNYAPAKQSKKKNNHLFAANLLDVKKSERSAQGMVPKQKAAGINILFNNDQISNNLTSIIRSEKTKASPEQTIPGISPNNSNNQENSGLMPNTINKKTRLLRFYIGIATGLQATQVKAQGFNKPGWSVGIIGGLHFNKKFSIESGLFYSNKNYYSKGKYFDMKKAGGSMPANMELISLTGTNRMFEIPIKLKYDFIQRSKSNWFFTAGISSSLITKEKNNYVALINNTSQNFTGNYDNNKFYFLSAATVSIGNEFSIGKKLNVRIEPYLSIPLRGVGIGSLQMMTTGIHLGILKHTKYRY